MSEHNRIYLCLAHMSEAGLEQKYIQEAGRGAKAKVRSMKYEG